MIFLVIMTMFLTDKLFDDDRIKYNPELENSIYVLLKGNVSASKIGEVIKTVLKLVNIELC